MNKCIGCGAVLQQKDAKLEGYVVKEHSMLCERCFRIQHYNDYQMMDKQNQDFLPIIEQICKTNDLVVLVVDPFCITQELHFLEQMITNPVLLVVTKKDLYPSILSEEKLGLYLEEFSFQYVDKIMISSKKNDQMDTLFFKIKQYKTSNRVYIIGFTNSGKSTMMNQIIQNYTHQKGGITTSILPSTTLNTIEIPIDDDLVLIDTPGLLDKGSMIHYASVDVLKKMMTGSKVKPITFQVKGKQWIQIEKLVRIEVVQTNVTLYFPVLLKIERFYKPVEDTLDWETHIFHVNHEDVIIEGLGFIHVRDCAQIIVSTYKGVRVYKRRAFF